jgi:hypothetical protein
VHHSRGQGKGRRKGFTEMHYARVLDAARQHPVELVWSHLKRSLANLARRNIAQLTALVKSRLRRMQHRPGLLEGFLASTRLDPTPPGSPHG